MPKKNADYFEKKRNLILDAALAVCMRKPMHQVSMRDVISETGFSQGGIYRYYSNLDEILAGLINRETLRVDIRAQVEATVSSGEVPEKVIGEIFSIWEKAVLDNLDVIGKIYYELCIIYVHDKERLYNFKSNILFVIDEDYLWEEMYQFLERCISEGYFTPKLSQEDLVRLHVTSLDGIIRDLILCGHYGISLPFPGGLEKTRLLKSFCKTLVVMLGGNEKLIYGGSPL